MSADFPFTIPDRLPILIDPCPIVEAVLEVRFVTGESWSVLPGLLFNQIRGRYPLQEDLPLNQVPEFVRQSPDLKQDLKHKPLVQFSGSDFIVRFGPRVISLISKPDAYPGWQRVSSEMRLLLIDLSNAGFITEAERLGIRYIDFFKDNVFRNLVIGGHVGGTPIDSNELTLTTIFRRPPFSGRLMITNGAKIQVGESNRTGSVLDIDVSAGALDFDLFTNGLERLGEMHYLTKGVFFSLLKESFLTTLNPTFP